MNPALRRSHLLLIVIALVIRLGWSGVQSFRDGTTLTYDDERLHWQIAANLIRTGSMITDDGRLAARMPLYPLFLAGFAGLGEYGIIVARLAQALIGALVVAIGIRVCLRLFGERAALLGGILLCMDPFAIFFGALLLNETLYSAALMLLVAMLLGMRSQPGFRLIDALLLGVVASGLIMLRPEAVGLWIAAASVLLLSRGWSPTTMDQAATHTKKLGVFSTVAVAMVVVGAVIFAWGWRNRGVLDTWVFVSCNGGATLYDGQGPQADGSSRQDFMRQLPELDGLDEVERDRRLAELAWQQMRTDPQRVATLAIVKLARTWSLTPNVETHRGGVTAAISLVYMLLLYGLLVVAARQLGTGLLKLWPLWLPVAFLLAVTAIYVGSVRYRVPYMPLMEILASASALSRFQPPVRSPGMIQK
jgi:hypothetical protein